MVDYVFYPISLEDILNIEKWTYDGYLKKILMEPYHINFASSGKYKGPDFCDGFSVYLGKDLFGLFEYYHRNDFVEIGLAINPKYIGKGYSKSFIEAGISFLKQYFSYQKDYICLTVDKENLQAYKAYLKSGFFVVNEFEDEILMRKNI